MDNIAKIATISLEPGETHKATDKLFILIFLINVVVWIWTGINNVFEIYERDKGEILFNEGFETILFRTGVYGIIAIAVSLLFLVVQSVLKFRRTVFVAIFVITIQILGLLILIPWLIYAIFDSYYLSVPSGLTIIALIVAIICLIYQVITFICVKEVDKIVLIELINESSRAALHSFFPIILSMLTSFLIIVIAFFTVIVSYNMIRDRDIFSSLSMCLFAFEGLFIINCISNFGFIVTGDCLANYYGAVDKQQFSKFYIFRSMVKIARNHLGTVVLLSTPILPRISAFVMSFSTIRIDDKDYNEKSDNKLIKFAGKISLMMNITDFALIQTSNLGSNALKSTREMFDLYKYTSTLFLSLNTISIKFIHIATGLAMIVIVIGRTLFIDLHYAHKDFFMNSAVISMTLIYTMFVHEILIRPAMVTFSIYKMIGVRLSDTSKQMILP